MKPIRRFHHQGRTYRLGRRRPEHRSVYGLRLADYITAPLAFMGATAEPRPPASWSDNTVPAKSFLADILGNDQSGDCTAAAAFHINGMMLADAGEPIAFTDDQCKSFYEKQSGWNGVVNDPSDTGCDEQAVLDAWRDSGLLPDGSHRIAGWVAVNASDKYECMLSAWLFYLYFGVEMPDAWVNPFPSSDGFVWDVAGDPNPDNGHAFCSVGFNAAGPQIDTWGLIGTMTWAACAKYASTTQTAGGELYAVISEDQLNEATKLAPSGIDWAGLSEDFKDLPSQ